MDWISNLDIILKAASDILTAGIAIIAFSLFINALTFQLRDIVTKSFTFVLLSIVTIFGTDAFITVIQDLNILKIVIKIHWLGLILLPTAYYLFSDALLTLTGKPSKGKRKIAGWISILISTGFAGLLLTDLLVGNLITGFSPAPYLERTVLNDVFSIFFFGVLALSWYNFIRTYKRTLTKLSRRRMLYLIISAVGPAVGSFPYLLYGSAFAAQYQAFFWFLSLIANGLVAISIIGMTYSVSFFGFPWPDRVIKSRLFRWVMRGPITASLTLGITTIITRLGKQFGVDTSAIVILAMVASIVLFEFLVTIFAPIWERIFFYGDGKQELEKIRALEERLLTTNDIRQFLELILTSICDRLQISGANLIVNNFSTDNLDIKTGTAVTLKPDEKKSILEKLSNKKREQNKSHKGFALLPLIDSGEDDSENLLGAVILSQDVVVGQDPDKKKALDQLVSRVTLALKDRKEQERLFVSLEMLTPQVSVIQDLLASSRIDQSRILNGGRKVDPRTLEKWVRDALTQIWGGPKLLQNPILQLNAVQMRVNEKNESPLNAIRELLREAANTLKPEGDRQYTNEWILYNIVDLKFFEGWKVRDIAKRLALSEADLYRKQRIAINEISKRIIGFEEKASQ